VRRECCTLARYPLALRGGTAEGGMEEEDGGGENEEESPPRSNGDEFRPAASEPETLNPKPLSKP